jgi:phosphopantothenoylcysteine decarboxylase/phosphopantothenate--cysteine ligase
MAAAVADYTPFKTSRLKIRKSSRSITLKLKPTPDILKWAGQQKKVKSQKAKVKKQIVVGFALEDRNLRANAERKMREKHLNMVVANKPEAIGADKSTVWIKPANGNWTSITNKSKSTTAGTVIQLAENALHREKQ